MSLQNEMRVIPIVAKVLAFLAYIGIAIGLIAIAIPQARETSALPKGSQIALGIFAAAIPAIYILLLGYIYGDARRRRMRYIIWTLLAIFIPNAIGVILYFILRDPLPVFCPRCGASVKSAFTFCPQCATSLRPVCVQCGRAVEWNWAHCPSCGTATAAAKQPATPAPPAAPQPL
jgi:RNA polymerase subunit RPABC4/transcription elongation factor Spt4